MPASPAPGLLPQRGGQRAPHPPMGHTPPQPSPAGLGAGDWPPAASLPAAPSAARTAPWQPPGSMAQPNGERGSLTSAPVSPEPECQICYSRYDARARQPTWLPCGHRLCARCLHTMVALGDASHHPLCCPFCRRRSLVPPGDTRRLQDYGAALAPGCERAGAQGPPRSPEVLLCPAVLDPPPGPSCLVVTILEVPAGAPAGLGDVEPVRLYGPGTLPCHGHKGRSWGGGAVPRCVLGALGLICVSSLPLGIYLLLMERHGPGTVLASLMPAALLLGAAGSLGQCLCRGLCGCPRS
ncbi:E3 ubiquitin-protein ligase RNF182-like [Pterocles gutturalis]